MRSFHVASLSAVFALFAGVFGSQTSQAALTLSVSQISLNQTATTATYVFALNAASNTGESISSYGFRLTSNTGTNTAAWSGQSNANAGSGWSTFSVANSIAGSQINFTGGTPNLTPYTAVVPNVPTEIGRATLTINKGATTQPISLTFTSIATKDDPAFTGAFVEIGPRAAVTISTANGSTLFSGSISAVPEPTSLLLAGLAVGGFGVRRRFLLRKKA